MNRAPYDGTPLPLTGVVSRAIGDEIVVVHPTTHVAHALSGPLAQVWREANGDFTPRHALTDGERTLAVTELQAHGLLQGLGLGRRGLLKRVGAVSGATMGAAITTIVLPEAAMAASREGPASTAPGPLAGRVLGAGDGITQIDFTITSGGGGGRRFARGGSGRSLVGNIRRIDGAEIVGTVTGYVGGGGRSSGAAGIGGTFSGGAGGPEGTFGSENGGGGGGATSLVLDTTTLVVAGGGGGGAGADGGQAGAGGDAGVNGGTGNRTNNGGPGRNNGGGGQRTPFDGASGSGSNQLSGRGGAGGQAGGTAPGPVEVPGGGGGGGGGGLIGGGGGGGADRSSSGTTYSGGGGAGGVSTGTGTGTSTGVVTVGAFKITITGNVLANNGGASSSNGGDGIASTQFRTV